jgi:hypothetical protein
MMAASGTSDTLINSQASGSGEIINAETDLETGSEEYATLRDLVGREEVTTTSGNSIFRLSFKLIT